MTKYMALSVGCLVIATPVWGETVAAAAVKAQSVQKMPLFSGKSTVLMTPFPIKRVSVANPDIADTIVLSPTQLYVTGKSPGVTNLTLWQDNGQIMSVFDLDVSPDLSRLKEQLNQLLPNDKEIAVQATNDHLTLSGSVSTPAVQTQVLALAEAFAPKKVINLLRVLATQPEPRDVVKVELIKGASISNVKFSSNGDE